MLTFSILVVLLLFGVLAGCVSILCTEWITPSEKIQDATSAAGIDKF